MAHIPIDLPDQSVHVHAQRELAFEMVAALGPEIDAGSNNARGGGAAVKVLATNAGRQLVEFYTPLNLGPIKTTWKTTEWVTPKSPESIEFDLLPDSGALAGGLRELRDQLVFTEAGNCTILTYKSRFGIRWSVAGWLVGKALVSPVIKRHMLDHLVEVKKKIESRARRSRVYPQLECAEIAGESDGMLSEST